LAYIFVINLKQLLLGFYLIAGSYLLIHSILTSKTQLSSLINLPFD